MNMWANELTTLAKILIAHIGKKQERNIQRGMIVQIYFLLKQIKVMIQDLTISYVCNGIETTLTIKDDHYDNMPYKLADMFAKVIRESDANPQIVIENLKSAFEYEQ